MKGIVWHSLDLRTEWNPALSKAAEECEKIIPLYIYSPKLEKLGEASMWWLHHALAALEQDYKKLGGKLIIRKGDPAKILQDVVKETQADAAYWNHRFDPPLFSVQSKLEKQLQKTECQVTTFHGNHLIDPRKILAGNGKPYSVFTPFYKTCLKEYERPVRPRQVKKISTPSLASSTLTKLALLPQKQWTKKLEEEWDPSRAGGLTALKIFLRSGIKDYKKNRDNPAKYGTSSLSPYLHFGQICPQEIVANAKGGENFIRQLFWREFGNYFLFHSPQSTKGNWNAKFDTFPWDKSPSKFKKWSKGLTGYPIVDAGMRELWETGWMHNRVRMVVASFLTKDLLIDWKEGEKWFWDTLVDADKGNNVLGWQWTAGCGPDAAPYFRVFNPVLQGEKFDPDGDYITTYCPELAKLPKKWIHRPWEAPAEVLEKAGVSLGKNYPLPVVDHKKARNEALKRYNKIK